MGLKKIKVQFSLEKIQKLYIINQVKIGNHSNQMLHVQPTKHHLPIFSQNHNKENDYFLVRDSELKLIRQLFDEMTFAIFQKQQSFLVVLLKKFCMQIISRKLSFPLLEEIFELLKQQESDMRMHKEHLMGLEQIMFQHEQQFTQQLTQTLQLEQDEEQVRESVLDCSIAKNKQLLVVEDGDGEGGRMESNAKSLSIDIDCFSDDQLRENFVSFDDKYFCSENLTTSEDQRELTSKSTILKQMKEQLQSKLKIQPSVPGLSLSIQAHIQPIDLEKQLLDWKRTKRSILQQPCLQKALSPNDINESLIMQHLKQKHYREKVKSAIVKKRLSAKHLNS